MKPILFITGGTGFIGRHLLQQLDPRQFKSVYCLIRRDAALRPFSDSGKVRVVIGDLLAPDTYSSALAESDVVLHLAAATGNAPADEHFRVNVEGTRQLLARCKDLALPYFLYASSIAARFTEIRHYPYAQSKQQAEALVRGSGLRYTIVRPTIVLGRGSPIGHRLHSLATAGVTPVIGSGSAAIQPIDVDDVADLLLHISATGRFANETLELGGPEVLTMKTLLARMHHQRHGKNPRFVHVPVGPLQSMLAVLGRFVRRLPVTAGQLASFVNDGTAQPNDLVATRQAQLKSVDQMIDMLEQHA